MNKPNFDINSSASISEEFKKRNIFTFKDASLYTADLPYARNADKDNLLTVFTDQCGTCSTKHALLKALADENGFQDLKLIVGIFKMNGENTPQIQPVLENYQLNYIPEAHCYLRYDGKILDFTKANSDPADFENDILDEIEIRPHQIADHKVNYHKLFLENWLKNDLEINYNLEEIWDIREKCIEIF